MTMPNPDTMTFQAYEGLNTVLLDLPVPRATDLPFEVRHRWNPLPLLLRTLLGNSEMLDEDAMIEGIILLARELGIREAQAVTVVLNTTCSLPVGPLLGGGVHLGSFAEHWFEDENGSLFDQAVYEETGVVSVWVDTNFWDQGNFDHEIATVQTFDQPQPIADALTVMAAGQEWELEALQAAQTLGVSHAECIFTLEDYSAIQSPGPVQGRPGAMFLGTFPLT